VNTRPGADAIVMSLDRPWQKIRASIEEYGREMYEAGRAAASEPPGCVVCHVWAGIVCLNCAPFCPADPVPQADGAGEEFIMGPESCS